MTKLKTKLTRDEDPDRPAHWMPQVLPDDDRAWYYNVEH
jgi:hypothetical protein